MMKIKVISRENIKPSKSTPNHLRYLQASLFDHVNTPVLMPLVFFFTPQKNNILTTNESTMLNQLKGSLPYTLSLFYPLAGRFKDMNQIDCNDEGVPYVEAKVTDTCFEDLVHKSEVDQLDLLLPCEGREGYSRFLLAIQVNEFPCGGLAIGVKMSHSISDAFSFSMFVKTWANITKDKEHFALTPRPYFEIWKVFPSKKYTLTEPDLDLIQVKPLTKRFKFSKHKLEDIRAKLYTCDYTTSINNKIPSLALILSAFIWSRVKMACRGSDTRPCQVFHAINIRPKVKAPEKHYYFGNMVINAIAELCVSLEVTNASDTEFLCREFLGRMEESMDKIITDDELIREIRVGNEDLRFMLEGFERESRGEITGLGFSSLRSLPLYEADFGWGKPIWVTMGSLVYKDLVILIPSSPLSQDIEAYISLSYEEMSKLERDKEFLVFASGVATSKL